MKGYSAREVAAMLGLTIPQVRSYASSGLLSPVRGTRGEYRFSFHDLVLLRAAKGLIDAKIPVRKIHATLRRLREQLPTDRPLTAVRITAFGDEIVVRDGDSAWTPDSGQALFDFAVADLPPAAESAAFGISRVEKETGAEEWYSSGCDLESHDPAGAAEAYQRAIALEPAHTDAHVNLGRILHEAGRVREAESHYRTALATSPDHAVAAFNLGVALEDLARPGEAIEAYQRAVASSPDFADAHFNLARLYEKAGKKAAAFRHLKNYRMLVKA